MIYLLFWITFKFTNVQCEYGEYHDVITSDTIAQMFRTLEEAETEQQLKEDDN